MSVTVTVDASATDRTGSGRDLVSVSVIVPVYQTPEVLLRRCLDSLLGQSLTSIQVIAVDDASPDTCPQILDASAAREPRMLVVHRAVNGKVGLARNDGLDRARGDYVLFVDADDTARPDYCETLLNLARRHNADIVASAFTLHRPSGVRIGRGHWPDRRYDLTDPRQQVRAIRHLRHTVWNKLYRRTMIADLRFPRFPSGIGEDAVFNAACFARSRIMVTTSYAGYCYYVNPLSATNRSSKGVAYLETSAAAHRMIIDAFKDSGASHIRRAYEGLWALSRFAQGCRWIAEEADANTRAAMWNCWDSFFRVSVQQHLRGGPAVTGLYRKLVEARRAAWLSRLSRSLYWVWSHAALYAIRDDLAARFATWLSARRGPGSRSCLRRTRGGTPAQEVRV